MTVSFSNTDEIFPSLPVLDSKVYLIPDVVLLINIAVKLNCTLMYVYILIQELYN